MRGINTLSFRIIIILSLLLSCLVGCSKNNSKEDFTIENLKVCHLENPLSIDEPPNFSFNMQSSANDIYQKNCKISVFNSPIDSSIEKTLLWEKEFSDYSSVGLIYDGPELMPKTKYLWQVTVTDNHNHTVISDIASFETGLMNKGMYSKEGKEAAFISAPSDSDLFKTALNSGTQALMDNFDCRRFRISYDMEVSKGSACFVFGADKGRYGHMNLCRITNNEETVSFDILTMNNGAFENNAEPIYSWDISAFKVSDSFSILLTVYDNFIQAAVNGNELDVVELEDAPIGNIGVYKIRSINDAALDNLKIEAFTGDEILSENFDNESTIFAPYSHSVKNERLIFGSGLLLTGTWDNPAPLFQKNFNLQDKEIAKARLYMTALGSYDIVLNGNRVTKNYFDPGKLAYNRELSYCTYDVTDYINRGNHNALGITLLHGWFNRANGYPEIANPWGTENSLCGMLEVTYIDDTVDTILTDDSFLCNINGPVRFNDIYQGEIYDNSYNDSAFGTLDLNMDDYIPSILCQSELIPDTASIKAKINEPISAINELTPTLVSEPLPGIFVYDFGQNFSGTINVNLNEPVLDGKVITFKYAEALNTEALDNPDDIPGTIWTRNLLTADAADYYISDGSKIEDFSFTHTYHGFRYLQIEGLDNPIPVENIKGITLSSDIADSGSFECSNELLNQFYKNTKWGLRSNFLDNPTDCAQRDERHGWAGDAQIFSLAATYHNNTYNFYRKYLNELRLLQTSEGAYPDMAPRNFGTDIYGLNGTGGHNCWGDASMVIAYNLYLMYGDKTILLENYDALCRWVNYLENTSQDYIRYGEGYGDHLSTENTPIDVSDTAWCAHSADLLSRIAVIIEKDEDAVYYKDLYEKFKNAWSNRYVNQDGTTLCDSQTSYALGLSFNLFPDNLREQAIERLSNKLSESDYQITSGFSGIGYLLPSLSENNKTDIAYKTLLNNNYPSLLYPVSKGLTTTAEMLSAYTENENGTYHLDGSLNHYAYGSPISFIYTDILGIKADENDPGFHHFYLAPQLTDELSYARGSYESPYGKIESSWEYSEGKFIFRCTVPANTSATVMLPGMDKTELKSGNYEFSISQ